MVQEAITTISAKDGDAVEVPNIEGFWAIRKISNNYSLNTSHWRILTTDPKYIHPEIATIYDNGDLFIRNYSGRMWNTDTNRIDLANNPIQTIRYVFLKLQKPISENLLLKNLLKEKQLKQTMQVLPAGTKGMPKGWYAHKGVETGDWYFYRDKGHYELGHYIGYITSRGMLKFQQPEHIENTIIYDRIDLYNNPIKAAQYIWLKTQKPIS